MPEPIFPSDCRRDWHMPEAPDVDPPSRNLLDYLLNGARPRWRGSPPSWAVAKVVSPALQAHREREPSNMAKLLMTYAVVDEGNVDAAEAMAASWSALGIDDHEAVDWARLHPKLTDTATIATLRRAGVNGRDAGRIVATQSCRMTAFRAVALGLATAQVVSYQLRRSRHVS